MGKLIRNALFALVLAALVYAGFSVFADLHRVAHAIEGFPAGFFFAACGLAIANYMVRLVRWNLYLRVVGVSVPGGTSALVFFSGLVMAISPAKVGEVLKSYLLKRAAKAPMADTVPVVVAERLTDLVAVLILTLGGVGSVSGAWPVVVAGGLLVAGLLVVVAWKSLALGILHRVGRIGRLAGVARHAEQSYLSMAALVRPKRLAWGVALGLVAWLCEALGFHLVLSGFSGMDPELGRSVFIYAFSTAAGAVSFLPGGLGVTEGGLVGLTLAMVSGAVRSTAVAATVLVRIATLWLAVVVGFGAYALFEVRLRSEGKGPSDRSKGPSDQGRGPSDQGKGPSDQGKGQSGAEAHQEDPEQEEQAHREPENGHGPGR